MQINRNKGVLIGFAAGVLILAAFLPLKNLINGWIEGLQLMKVGSIYRFAIPPELAHEDKGQAQIPANATLVFEAELLEIEKTKSK